ncbi:MAG: hypothetical protein WDA41_09645 [Candidatus Neomarinimicrobiota bacterium]
MNIVFVKHEGCCNDFVFRVPDELVPHIDKNQTVLVNTMHGLALGITQTNVICGPGVQDIAIKTGAYLPLKSVVGFDCLVLKLKHLNQIRNVFDSVMEDSNDELPF